MASKRKLEKRSAGNALNREELDVEGTSEGNRG